MLFLSQHLYAQQTSNKSDSIFVNDLIVNALSFYDTRNLDSSMIICNKAIAYSQNKNYTAGKAIVYNKMADIAYQQNNLSAMVHYDSLALQFAQSLNNKDLEASESSYNKAIKIAEGDEVLTADIYNSLGYMYGLQGEPDKSVDW